MARRNKPRKWSNLKDVLPAAPAKESGEWIEKVFAEKDKRADYTMEELDAEYALLVAEDEAAAAAQRERNIKYEALERRILEELEKVQTVSGQDMWRSREGHTFSPKYDPYPIVKDKAALMQWIRDSKLEDLLTLTKPTLKMIVREAFDTELAALMSPGQRAQLKPGQAGSGAPPPGVEVFLKTGVNARVGSKRTRDDEDDE